MYCIRTTEMVDVGMMTALYILYNIGIKRKIQGCGTDNYWRLCNEQ